VAHSLSSKKRIRQNAKRNARNRWRKDQVKQVVRGFDDALKSGDKAKAVEQLQAVYKKIDQVAAKGTIHKKTADRRKSRLTKQLNKLAS
jgi:small subunit ribosomal protein S20